MIERSARARKKNEVMRSNEESNEKKRNVSVGCEAKRPKND